jgi:hypothetical protein
MIHKKSSYGSAVYWINGHYLTLRRYLNDFYPIYDWNIIKHFFVKNPIQAKVILDDYNSTNESKQKKVMEIVREGKSKIIYICGGRGWGKSCLAFWIAEKIHYSQNPIPIYVVGEGVIKKFPEWVKYKDRIQDVPNGVFVILDEASIRYNAREYFKEANILLGKMLAIARHKDLSIIFITQHINLMDINITRLRDMIIWKKMNSYYFGEKGGGRASRADKFWDKVRMNMAPRSKEETLLEYPAEKRFIHFRNEKPTFWTEEMSRSFEGYKFKDKEEESIKASKIKRPKVLRI